MDKTLFKKGLGTTEDAVERSAIRSDGIRKKKKEDVLARRRNQSKPATLTQFQTLCKEYVFGKSFNILQILCRIGTNQELQDEFPNLLYSGERKNGPEIVQVLVRMASFPSPDTTPALDTLVNITGASTSYAVEIAQTIIREGFLNHAIKYIQTDPAQVKPEWLNDIWGVVANLVCLCPEARDIVLASMYPQAFYTQVQRGTVEISTLLLIICGSLEVSPVLPPNEFFMTAWPFLVAQLKTLYAQEHADGLDFVLCAFVAIASRCTDVEFFQSLVNYNQMEIIPIMITVCKKLTDNVNKLRICQFLVRVGMLPHIQFQECMKKHGCLELMIRMTQDSAERLRREGLVWLGNFASEGIEYVELILEKNALEAVINTIRRQHRHFLVRNSIYVLIAMCNSCLRCADRNRAENVMGFLFDTKQVISLTVPYVDVVANENMTIDILQLWRDALKWKREFISPLIEERGGFDRVAKLIGTRNTTIFKLCSEIEDLNNANEMEIEATVFDSKPIGIDPSNPTVFHGGFNF